MDNGRDYKLIVHRLGTIIKIAYDEHILTVFEFYFGESECLRICIPSHGIIVGRYQRRRFLQSRCVYSSNTTATCNPCVIRLILIQCCDIGIQHGPTLQSTRRSNHSCMTLENTSLIDRNRNESFNSIRK